MKTKSGWEISGCVKNKRIELLTTAAPYVPAPIKRHPISYNHPPTPLTAVYMCVCTVYMYRAICLYISCRIESDVFHIYSGSPPLHELVGIGCMRWKRRKKKRRNHGKTKLNPRQSIYSVIYR